MARWLSGWNANDPSTVARLTPRNSSGHSCNRLPNLELELTHPDEVLRDLREPLLHLMNDVLRPVLEVLVNLCECPRNGRHSYCVPEHTQRRRDLDQLIGLDVLSRSIL